MKCTYSDECTTEMDPPKITVVIHDLENGTAVGYYDTHECALKDVTGTLEHLRDNAKLEGAPAAFSRDPLFVENPGAHEAGTVIDVGLEVESPQPPYNAKKYRKAVTVADQISQTILNQANSVWSMRGQTWNLETEEGVYAETSNGFKVPYTKCTYALEGRDFQFEIGHDDDKVWLRFNGNDEWNLKIDPDTFSRSSHSNYITQHVEVLASNSRVQAPPAQAAGDAN